MAEHNEAPDARRAEPREPITIRCPQMPGHRPCGALFCGGVAVQGCDRCERHGGKAVAR